MIYLKSSEDLAIIKENGDILGRCHAEVAKAIRPGVTTLELDKIAYEFICDNHAHPSFLNYQVGNKKYAYSLCISVNDVVVHGLPGSLVLKEGDTIAIDAGVYKKGFHADSAYTYAIGDVDQNSKDLLQRTKESLYLGIKQAHNGKRIGDVGSAVQTYAESFGYGVVRELVGHGVGKNLHESPEVPNYGRKGDGIKLKEGMVIAIEPMINLGVRQITVDKDGWTIRTKDRKNSAHFEHTVAVGKEEAEILTTFSYIEEVIKTSTILLNI
ncbi:type I methionyl aminopeptidase [Aquirufa sp. ROCK2-A2]